MPDETKARRNSKPSPMPWYQDVPEHQIKIPGWFSVELFNSALKYKPRPDDLFIVTYPKCGTTWVQTIVGLIFRQGKPFASALEFMPAAPFLEFAGAESAEKMQRPGAIKMHEPFRLTPYSSEAKYIFVARNPKDCCVSFYHHTVNFPGYRYEIGTFDDFFELFINGDVDFGDYFDTLLSWYEHKDDPNVLFITYEQLLKDTRGNILKIAEFMGPEYKELLERDENVFQAVIQHSSFNSMKSFLNNSMSEMGSIPMEVIENNPDFPESFKKMFAATQEMMKNRPPAINFVRKGIVGDWRNYFSPTQNERLMKKFHEKTAGTNIPDLWKEDM